MAIRITPIGEIFAATVTEIDLSRDIEAADLTALLDAFEQHSVLVLPDQPIGDERQIAFSNHFGPLEHTAKSNPAGDTFFARQSNVDINSGELLAIATQPANCHRHEWREHDIVIWDNRAVLHRATPYDGTRNRRLMQRTTVSSGTAAGLPTMEDQQ